MWCLSFFWYIFGRFSMKFRWNNRLIIFTPARVFFKLATLTKHCKLRYETYFFIFCSFHFFSEKLKKWVQNWTPKKTSKKGPTGTQNGPPNHENWDGQILKISRIAPKYCFLRGWFFDDFLDGQKTDPRGYATQRQFRFTPPWAPLGGRGNN